MQKAKAAERREHKAGAFAIEHFVVQRDEQASKRLATMAGLLHAAPGGWRPKGTKRTR